MPRKREQVGLSDAEDLTDSALNVIDEIVDEVLHKMKQKNDRKAFLIKLEEYCVNHPCSRGAMP